jgi:MoxR-like ATPase
LQLRGRTGRRGQRRLKRDAATLEFVPTLASSAAALREAIAEASRGLVERETLVELIALSAVAGEHMLVVGPPGTAKSEAVRRIAGALGGRYFEYLLGRFTEPSEIFGPVDLRKLRDGTVETETRGMLPEAEIAFLDEVFLGSTAILNTLLGVLNERTFRRGHTQLDCPLRVCVGASNALPEDEMLAAFADRFLVRTFVEPIADARIEDLLAGAWSLGRTTKKMHYAPILGELDTLARAAEGADLSGVRDMVAHALRKLRAAGIVLSDRRATKIQKLVAAAAALAGRANPTAADLWPIVYAVPTDSAQRTAREALRALLEASENPALQSAALEASHGPRARATRIVAAGRALLAEQRTAPREAGEASEAEAHRLRIEGVLREIDAAFAEEQLTPELRALRAELASALPPP